MAEALQPYKGELLNGRGGRGSPSAKKEGHSKRRRSVVKKGCSPRKKKWKRKGGGPVIEKVGKRSPYRGSFNKERMTATT